MEKGTWSKSPPELVELFESVFPGPPAVARPMFGFRAGFVNGNMFMSLFQDKMVLRLPDDQREELLGIPGAGDFEPMPGRPMTGYATVPPSLLDEPDALEGWVARALSYGESLPAKAPKPKAAKPKAPKPKAAPAKAALAKAARAVQPKPKPKARAKPKL